MSRHNDHQNVRCRAKIHQRNGVKKFESLGAPLGTFLCILINWERSWQLSQRGSESAHLSSPH